MPEGKDEIQVENQPAQTVPKRFAREFFEIGKVLLISILIVVPIRYFIVQPFVVRGASMEPNFEDHEYLVIDEVSYYIRPPARGEVIVFRYPKIPTQFFIKRIIGLPREQVEITDSRVRVMNAEYPKGILLDEKYLPEGQTTSPNISTTLSASEYFVLGDNREFSSDSRIWGALDKKFIIGRVLFRAWPVEKIGITPAQ